MKYLPVIQEVVCKSIDDNNLSIMREDLLPFSFGGNKLRIADVFIEDMLDKKQNLMITYGNVRSNLSRAISAECCRRNIPVWIISPSEGVVDSIRTYNRLLSEMSHARIIECAKSKVRLTVLDCLEEAKIKGYIPYYIYGNEYGDGNKSTPIRAYYDVWQDNLWKFDYVFLATGTGMTQAGLICGKILDKNTTMTRIVGLSIARAPEDVRINVKNYVEAFVQSQGEIPKNMNDKYYIDVYDARFGGYGLYNDEIEKTIMQHWEVNGIGMDPVYTGKAFTAMIRYVKEYNLSKKRILFIHTGGAPLFFDWLANRV